MQAEISFNCDGLHGSWDPIYDGAPYSIAVLLRHQGDRLYFFKVEGHNDDVIMDAVRRAIDDLPVQLSAYGFTQVTGAHLACSVHRVIDTCTLGFGSTDDRCMRDSEYPVLKASRVCLPRMPWVKDMTCVVELS